MRIEPMRITSGQQQLPGPVGFGQGGFFRSKMAGGIVGPKAYFWPGPVMGGEKGSSPSRIIGGILKTGLRLRRLFPERFYHWDSGCFGLLQWDGLGLLLKDCGDRRYGLRAFDRDG